jgi:hypothetical protein
MPEHSDPEKAGLGASIDHVERTPSETSNDAIIAEFSPEEQKNILWRIDIRLVTTLGLMYCASLMDRTNLASAAIAGSACPLLLPSNCTAVSTALTA